ncbi:MAG: diaminopimelate epimerase [Lachnospirales bacterium]
MDFWKMNGIGNDYVYVLDLKKEINNEKELSIKVSNRNFGIGSDGLVLIRNPQNTNSSADFRMDMYNADGSQSEMCGNAIRCVGKFVYDSNLTTKKEIIIETLAGDKVLKLNVLETDNKVLSVKVNMGEPILQGSLIPVSKDLDRVFDEEITVLDKKYLANCVSMGNPHNVIYLEKGEVAKLDLLSIGKYFENHELFPKKVNTEFVEIIDRDNLKMRVYERGSGETLACGTGACAVAVVSILKGLCNEKVNIHLLGGVLEIEYNPKDNFVYMTGSCDVQFIGKYLG